MKVKVSVFLEDIILYLKIQKKNKKTFVNNDRMH